MPGTLVITTLSDGTNSTSATNCIQGSAKAWVNFNGTGTVAILASYNVSSITDNGTGDYTINFTNAFADANYAICGFSRRDNDTGGVFQVISAVNSDTKTTTACRIRSFFQIGGSTALGDSTEVDVSIFR
jgi:hypothetical protein